MAYHQFTPADGSEPYGMFEVFQDIEASEACFYWWACSPGCFPDSDAIGPFDTESEAIADANGA